MYFSEDILVFLTGQEEIESVVKSIRDISHDLPSGTHVMQLVKTVLFFVCVTGIITN